MAKPSAEAEDLPKTIVRRLVKDKLSESTSDGGDFNIHKDALVAFSESARIFIHYLSATANDVCKESKRQTISADDVFKALEEIEFSEFIEPLKTSLEDFRRKNAGKKAATKSKDESKKRKVEEEPTEQNGKEEAVEEDAVEEEADGDENNMHDD